MRYSPDLDRSYWRDASIIRLLEAADRSGSELSIALAERLCDLTDVQDQLEEALKDLADEQQCRDKWQEEANDLRAELELRG